jgi:hypothetical protein
MPTAVLMIAQKVLIDQEDGEDLLATQSHLWILGVNYATKDLLLSP